MKGFLKILKWIGIGVLVIISGFIVFVHTASNKKYDALFPEITAGQDSSVIVIGVHLIYAPAPCVDCHSPTS